MSIQVYFFQNFEKKENSTKQPTLSTGTEFLCLLKEDTGVIEPEIEISLASNNPISYTYAYIPSWNRYYFVKNWEFTIGMRWRAYLKEDVLASFKTQIGALSPYVLRCSRRSDDNITDMLYPATNTWESHEDLTPMELNFLDNTIVIGIISNPTPSASDPTDPQGRPNVLGSVTYYATNRKDLATFIRYLLSSTFSQAFLENTVEDLGEYLVKDFVNPLDWIASVTLFPFDVTGGQFLPSLKPKLGWYDLSQVSDVPSFKRLSSLWTHIGDSSTYVNIYKNPNATLDKNFLKFPPFTRYELMFQPFGNISLNSEYMATKEKMYLGLDVDLVGGAGRLSLGSELNRADIGVYNAQLGVSVALSQMTQDLLHSGASFIRGTVGALVGGLATQNIAVGVGLAGNGLVNAVDQFMPQGDTQGTNGSILSYIGNNKGAILVTKYCDCVGIDVEHFGKPLCERITSISAVAGQSQSTYFKCSDGENHINCYDIEKKEISAFLLGGFFYE